jgi:hypothetical protein
MHGMTGPARAALNGQAPKPAGSRSALAARGFNGDSAAKQQSVVPRAGLRKNQPGSRGCLSRGGGRPGRNAIKVIQPETVLRWRRHGIALDWEISITWSLARWTP